MNTKTLIGTFHSPTPSLDLILEESIKRIRREPEGEGLHSRIIEAKTYIDKGFGQTDEAIQYSLTHCGVLEREAYHEAYVKYMGLTLHYCDKKNYEAGWFYYARANYCLGIYEGWEKVLDYLVEKDEERQTKARGGKAKYHAHNDLLVTPFIKIIIEKKPPNGWKSKKEVIDAALPTLEATIGLHGSKSFPLYENLESAARRWLNVGKIAYAAYAPRCAPTNPDWREVLMNFEATRPGNPKIS